MSAKATGLAWAEELCRKSGSTCPADVLEELMAAPECPAFGPAHHFLAGAAMLAAAANAGYPGDLDAQLAELAERSSCVPGGSCARWGVCGAAASGGMALADLLTTVQGSQKQALTDFSGDHFDGEIYVRLMLQGENRYYYVGFIDRSGNCLAFLADADTGEVLATKRP